MSQVVPQKRKRAQADNGDNLDRDPEWRPEPESDSGGEVAGVVVKRTEVYGHSDGRLEYEYTLYLQSCAFGLGPWLDFDSFYVVFNEHTSLLTICKTTKPGWKGGSRDVTCINLEEHVGRVQVSESHQLLILNTYNAPKIPQSLGCPRRTSAMVNTLQYGAPGQRGWIMFQFGHTLSNAAERRLFEDAMEAVADTQDKVVYVENSPSALISIANAYSAAANSLLKSTQLQQEHLTRHYASQEQLLERATRARTISPEMKESAQATLTRVRARLADLRSTEEERAATARELTKAKEKCAAWQKKDHEKDMVHARTVNRHINTLLVAELQRHDLEKLCESEKAAHAADRARLQGLQAGLETAQTQKAAAGADCERRLCNVRASLETTKGNLEAERKRATDQDTKLKDLEAGAADARRANETLSARVAGLEGENRGLLGDVSRLRGEHASLYTKIAELVAENKKLHDAATASRLGVVYSKPSHTLHAVADDQASEPSGSMTLHGSVP